MKSSASSNHRYCLSTFIALLAAPLIFSGCASVSKEVSELPEPIGMTADTYKVIMQDGSGKPEVFVGRLDEQKTMQDALVESGAAKRHKHMLVDLARAVDSGHVLRLPVTYNGSNKSVLEEQNYAVLPGDEILVRPNGRGPLDTMIQSITGQAAKRSHLSPK